MAELRIQVLAGCVLIACVLPTSSWAQQATTTFSVDAVVQKACLVTANPLAFGEYDPTSETSLDATTTLDVLCTVGTSYTVGLNAGTASGATVTTRRMVNGANTLDYALYQDAGYANNWGNTPGTDTPPASTALVTPGVHTVYGRIPPAQNVSGGGYVDTITVSVNY